MPLSRVIRMSLLRAIPIDDKLLECGFREGFAVLSSS
jgi:hypothetical protein